MFEYSLWYYQNYRVSKRKLEFKVKNKFLDDFSSDLFENIMEEISEYINEKEDILSIILWYKYKKKSAFYIKWKLFERMYESNLIEQSIFEEIDEEYEKNILKELFLRYSKEEIIEKKDKIIKSFQWKWFNYYLISEVLEEIFD